MRYIRIAAVIIFVFSFVLNAGATVWDRMYADDSRPVITCEQDYLEVRVDCLEEDLLAGMTAFDEKDGDLTDKIMIAEISRFVEPGVCNVKYVVFDSDHNGTEFTRQIRYVDYESPRFSITEPLVYVQGETADYLDSIKASDLLEGDISEKIKIVSSEVDNHTAGTYPIELEVMNSLGDTASLRTKVVILEHSSNGPEIALSRYLVYAKKGDKFDALQYVSSVIDRNGEEIQSPDIEVFGRVDTKKEGEYHLVYSVKDEEAGTEGKTYLTVVVTE